MTEYSTIKEISLFGKVVVIRRSGDDGSTFPLTMDHCVIGRYAQILMNFVFGKLLA